MTNEELQNGTNRILAYYRTLKDRSELEEFMVDQIEALQARVNGLQCALDWIMLEYCPEEMTIEQIDEFRKHQIAYDRDSNHDS